MIFIVGTGRSGTHFLTKCLISHPQVTDLLGGKEHQTRLDLSVQLAIEPNDRDARALCRMLAFANLRSGRRRLLDQSHPNLWNYEILSRRFPHAHWLALVREPRAVVASMLQHRAVRRRSEEWQSYPMPCRFLGITERNREQFSDATIAGRCAFRWRSHVARTLELARDGLVIPIDFDALVLRQTATMEALHRAIGVRPDPTGVASADRSVLDKWQQSLTPEQVLEIQGVADGTTDYRNLLDLMRDQPFL